jgi:type IV pilus assembly protein PilE
MSMARPPAGGFTLVELMIGIVIIGILATISYGTYTNQVMRSQRTAARALMHEVLQHQERFYTNNNSYTVDLTQLGYAAPLRSTRDTHDITLAIGPSGNIATSVAVTATSLRGDAKCTSLTLTSTNAQSATGSNPASCWQ